VTIFSQEDAYPVIPLPLEDHPSTQARQTGPRNKSQGTIANDTHMDC